MNEHPHLHLYRPEICRFCEDTLSSEYQVQGLVMHPQCEQSWLGLNPPPCKFCEGPLPEEDIAARHTYHAHCALELFSGPIPNRSLPENAEPQEVSDDPTGGEPCGLCGEPLFHDEDGGTMHEHCERIFQISDEEIQNEQDNDPILLCLDCSKRLNNSTAVGSPDPTEVYPLCQRCADLRRGLQ